LIIFADFNVGKVSLEVCRSMMAMLDVSFMEGLGSGGGHG